MAVLTEEQKRRAIEVMNEYLAVPPNPDGSGTLLERQAARDSKRVHFISTLFKGMVQEYLIGKIPLADFKSNVDSLNKQHEYWGFKGIKGQMFFNMIFNRAEDMYELGEELKAAIAIPNSEDMARSRIETFTNYVKRIGDEHVEGGGSKHGRPKIGSIPFFLSYFWQIQDHETWPVYYTNSVNTILDLNLWTLTGDLAADYITYKHIHEELAELFSKTSGHRFGLYDVEHVFWFKGGNPCGGDKLLPKDGTTVLTGESMTSVMDSETILRLPESHVPPVVSILPKMARNENELIDAAKTSGTSLERAFEKNINAAFTILGYETKLLGQGSGRVPDGTAVEMDNSYAILWDAKIRTNGYSMGTDDRTIHEYIVTQSRQMRKRSLRNIYYLVISSEFEDDYDDPIRSLKMETDVSEVCLVEAAALVAIVDAKLRTPQEITLGPDGLQRLFSTSGIITADSVRKTLG